MTYNFKKNYTYSILTVAVNGVFFTLKNYVYTRSRIVWSERWKEDRLCHFFVEAKGLHSGDTQAVYDDQIAKITCTGSLKKFLGVKHYQDIPKHPDAGKCFVPPEEEEEILYVWEHSGKDDWEETVTV